MKKRASVAILALCLALFLLLTVDFPALVTSVQTLNTEAPFFAPFIFCLVYIIATVLGLPAAAVLSISAGLIFGIYKGVAIIFVGAGISAVLSFLLARYLFRDFVNRKFTDIITKVNHGVQKEGLFYLFFLRLVPGIPFPVLNMSFGITNMHIYNYYWVSQIALIPSILLLVSAGTGVTDVSSVQGVITVRTTLSLAGMGAVPLVAKFVHKKIFKVEVEEIE